MIKKTVRYEDFNGNPTEEVLYFHLSKAELMDLEMDSDDGVKFSDRLTEIVNTSDASEVLKVMKELVLAGYGERSEDGKRFTKDEVTKLKFSNTEAYSELLYSLITDAKEAASFINGLFPADLMREAEAKMKADGDSTKQDSLEKMKALNDERTRLREEAKDAEAPEADLTKMSQEELIKLLESK